MMRAVLLILFWSLSLIATDSREEGSCSSSGSQDDSWKRLAEMFEKLVKEKETLSDAIKNPPWEDTINKIVERIHEQPFNESGNFLSGNFVSLYQELAMSLQKIYSLDLMEHYQKPAWEIPLITLTKRALPEWRGYQQLSIRNNS